MPEFTSPATQPPSVGRIVHFVLPDGEHRPAIITQVFGGTTANMTVFRDGDNDSRASRLVPQYSTSDGGMLTWATSVPFSEEAKPLTWHYPERV